MTDDDHRLLERLIEQVGRQAEELVQLRIELESLREEVRYELGIRSPALQRAHRERRA